MRISDWSSDVCSSDLWGAIVVVGAPVPVAIPAAGFDTLAQVTRQFAVLARQCRVALRGADRRKIGAYPDQEPGQPHAFAAATGTDPVEAVVPVAVADSRQAVRPDREGTNEDRKSVGSGTRV